MNLEDVKEKIKERLEEIKGQIESSQAFNTLKEHYENLSPTVQKTITWAGIVMVSLFLFSCPLTYWSTSSTNIAAYENTRNMIRDLLRTSHLAGQLSGGPEQIPLDTLQALVNGKLAELRLLPEQIAGVSTVDIESLGAALAPKEIVQEALQVSLKKLNLKQVVDLGFQMQEVHGTVKLAGMEVKATSENDHYFDVLFKLVKFSLPEAAGGPSEDSAATEGASGQSNVLQQEPPARNIRTQPRGGNTPGAESKTQPNPPSEEQEVDE